VKLLLETYSKLPEDKKKPKEKPAPKKPKEEVKTVPKPVVQLPAPSFKEITVS